MATSSTGAHIGAGADRPRGRYVLGDLLGRGGMAEVFAGQSLGSAGFTKPVAIKRLLPEHTNDAEFVDRLIDEAKLLVAMQHGNVVNVLDLVRETDDVFLVMEFVDGPSLRQLLVARGSHKLGPLPPGLATYVVHAAAIGLQFAHARPGGAIIHADVSPSNLLLTTSGEVKVADFGIARREGVGANGVVEGKWAYMAPEQARGEPLTACADVFALGVVLYELTTGVHPFARRVSSTGRDEGAARGVLPPRAIRPDLPPALDTICMRAIAHDPAERIQSMQQLADALVELRFASGWREGAAELAQAIRDVRVSRGRTSGGPQRPVTIITRSLLESRSQTEPDAIIAPGEARARADGTPSGTRRPASADGLAAGTSRGARPLGSAQIPTQADAAAAAAAAGMTIDISLAGAGEAVMPPVLLAATAVRPRRWAVAAIAIMVVIAFGAIAIATWRLLATDTAPPTVADPNAGLPPATGVTVEPIAPAVAAAAAAVTPPELTKVTASESTVATSQPVVAARVDEADGERGHKPTRRPAPHAAAPVKPAPVKPAPVKPAPAAKAAANGTLRVSAVPWAYVTVDGKTFETPHRFELAPGTYTVKLHSPDSGARETRSVTVNAGKIETLAVQMGGAQ